MPTFKANFPFTQIGAPEIRIMSRLVGDLCFMLVAAKSFTCWNSSVQHIVL